MKVSREVRRRSHILALLGFTVLGIPAATAGVPRDRVAPTTPTNVKVVSFKKSSVSLRWSRSRDNVRVVGYRVYRDGTTVGKTRIAKFTLRRLACGRRFSIGVEAYDAAANRSGRRMIPLTTQSCPATRLANLWVDPNGGTCSRRATAGGYADAAACASMNAAYQRAIPGDTVLATCASGSRCSFPFQTIVESARKAGTSDQRDVVFDTYPTKTITWNGIRLGTGNSNRGSDGPDNITIRDVVVPSTGTTDCTISAWRGSYWITFDNVDVCSFWVDAIHHFTLRDSDIGPCVAGTYTNLGDRNCHPSVTGSTFESRDIVIERNAFHDITKSNDSEHTECLRLTSGRGLILRRNTFDRCAVFDVAFYNGDQQISPALIENNWFGRPLARGSTYAPVGHPALAIGDDYPGVAGGGPITDLTVRFNTIADRTSINWDLSGAGGAHYVNVREIGNVGASGCSAMTRSRGQFVSSFNVQVPGSSCAGTGNVVAALGNVLLNATNGGDRYRLKGAKGSTSADDRVPAGAGCPSTDLAGTRRPVDAKCDAGVHER